MEKYYRDKCSFQEISAYGEELFQYLEELHRQGKEYAFVKEELPMYAKKYGGEIVSMSSEEEADFLMRCNGMENMEHMPETLHEFDRLGIPMYVLSNSGFSAGALSVALERLGIRKYFTKIWSSADYGQIKPCRDFFEMAIKDVLLESSDEKRENIIYIGDTYDTDVVGANAVGTDVIWLNHKGESNRDNLPVYQISDMSELAEVVKGLGEKYCNSQEDLV